MKCVCVAMGCFFSGARVVFRWCGAVPVRLKTSSTLISYAFYGIFWLVPAGRDDVVRNSA